MKLPFLEKIAKIADCQKEKSPQTLNRELGITHSISLASNENPWGPSPVAVKALSAAMTALHRYPDTSTSSLVETLARHIGVTSNEIVLGNGSREVMELLIKIIIQDGDEVITSSPSLLYQRLVQIQGGKNSVVPLRRLSHDLDRILAGISDMTRLIVLDNPTYPTGTALTPVELYSFLSNVPESVAVILDESFVEFMDQAKRVDIFSLIRNTKNRCGVVGVRTFSKAYGLAGLRIGYGIMPAEIADCLHKVRQPFNVNHLAQAAALAALKDQKYLEQTLERTRKEKEFLREELKKLGCTSYPSQTGSLLIDVKMDATRLYRAMLGKGVIVRPMSLYGYSDCIRINVGTKEENMRFLAVLAECLLDLEDA